MDVNNIGKFSNSSLISDLGNQISLPRAGEEDFGALVKNAVESIDNANKSAEQEIVKSVSGESTDLHKTIISLQTADLKFQLGLQVRNKLIGAYEEIMRMQV